MKMVIDGNITINVVESIIMQCHIKLEFHSQPFCSGMNKLTR